MTARTSKANSVILHSQADDVIPFCDSEELVAASRLPPETLVEIGNDVRLADPEPLAMILEVCERHCGSVIGCDFGVPKRAEDWAKKIILVEAIKVGKKHDAVRPFVPRHIRKKRTNSKVAHGKERVGTLLAGLDLARVARLFGSAAIGRRWCVQLLLWLPSNSFE